MLGSPVLEVALGLTSIYFALAIVSAAITGAVSELLRLRSAFMRGAMVRCFGTDDPRGHMLLIRFQDHPLIRGLSAPGPVRRSVVGRATTVVPADAKIRQGDVPGYVPAEVFATVVVDILVSSEVDLPPLPVPDLPPQPAPASLPSAIKKGGKPGAQSEWDAIVDMLEDLNTATDKITSPEIKLEVKTTIEKRKSQLLALSSNVDTARVWPEASELIKSIETKLGSSDDPGSREVLERLGRRRQELNSELRSLGVSRLAREAVGETLAVFRGAFESLTDRATRERLLELLGQAETTAVNAPLERGVATEAPSATWFGTLRGAVAVLTAKETKAALLDLVDRESIRLTSKLEGLPAWVALRAHAAELPSSELRTVLCPVLTNDKSYDLKNVLSVLEEWFRDAMDRVSVAYERRAKSILFLAALALCITLNFDTLFVAGQLSRPHVLAPRPQDTSAPKAVKGGPRPSGDEPDSPGTNPLLFGYSPSIISWGSQSLPERVGSIVGLLMSTFALWIMAPILYDLFEVLRLKLRQARTTSVP